MITRESVLGSPAKKPFEVKVPETGETLMLRYPTVGEWRELLVLQRDGGHDLPSASAMAAVIATVVVNADGSRMFTPADAAAIQEKEASVIVPIYKACMAAVMTIGNQVEDEEKKS